MKKDLYVVSLIKKINLRLLRYSQPLRKKLREFIIYFTFPFIKILSFFVLKNIKLKKNRKPHILITRNKWYASNKKEISTEKFHIDDTLIDAKIATFSVMHYESLYLNPISDIQLILKCRNERPNILLLSSWSDSQNQPSINTLKLIKNIGVYIIIFWWDSCSNYFIEKNKKLIDIADLNVILDNPLLKYQYPNFLCLWVPQTQRLFNNKLKKDIDVSFLGQVSNYRSVRNEYIDYLKKSLQDLNIYISKNDREYQISHIEYANILCRSKLSINFSQSVNGDQLKGRVFDILLSECVLLESNNDQTNKLFNPNKDYIEFSSKEDLVHKIKILLSDENLRKEIARNGKSKVMEKYNTEIFWKLILHSTKLF